METAFYAVLTILLWTLSSSVLLPFLLLLRLNKSFQNMWFSFFFSKVILPLVKHTLISSRKKAFKRLEEELPGRNKSLPLKILEIGVGDGANLPFYPENSKLTVVDMNPSFQPFFLANKEKHPQVELERIVISMAENMPEVPDNSMDVVVCTYVMCSVVEVASVLREVKRVLKPGGKFLFVEHVAYHELGMKYIIQRAVSPLWKIYFNGCYPAKDIGSYIDKAGFKSVTCERSLNPSVWLYIRPHLIGIATK